MKLKTMQAIEPDIACAAVGICQYCSSSYAFSDSMEKKSMASGYGGLWLGRYSATAKIDVLKESALMEGISTIAEMLGIVVDDDVLEVVAEPCGKRFISAVGIQEGRFRFHVYDMKGRIVAYIPGVIGSGAMPSGDNTSVEKRFTEFGYDVEIIDHRSMADFATLALGELETARIEAMGDRRKRHYLAGRIVLKRLARRLSRSGFAVGAKDIITVAEDGVRPDCRIGASGFSSPCSVAHDDRFAFGVAGRGRPGVDVELLSDKALHGLRLFLDKKEIACLHGSGFPLESASIRAWTAKEALAKAADIELASIWKQARIIEMGEHRSYLKFQGRKLEASHVEADGHVFCLIDIGER